MAGRRDKPEDILSKLRQVEVLQGQGMTIAGAARQIGMTEQTYYRRRNRMDVKNVLSCPEFPWP
jgi:putative transposase